MPAHHDPALERVTESFVRTLGPQSLLEFPLTALDHVGVPVWSTWWSEAAGAGTGGIGYGSTEQRARVGALGECVEHVCAARALAGAHYETGSLRALRAGHGVGAVVDPRRLCLPAGVPFDDDTDLVWLSMRRLENDSPVWVPAELVASAGSELPSVSPPGGWLTTPVSNGLGAGSTLAQALAHAVLEVVQRDGNGLTFRALDTGCVLDLDAVTDPETRAALDRLAAAGVEVLAKLASVDFGMANIDVVGSAPDDDILSATACGEAVHPDREVALRKALLEFANARPRKQLMHGPLEAVRAIAPPSYERVIASMDPAAEEQRVLTAMVDWLALPETTWRPLVAASVLRRHEIVAFADLPSTPAPGTSEEHLRDVVGRLADEGFEVLYRDLSPGDGSVHAVKVLIPGLEVETVAYHRIGERNAARLLADERFDLVVVGEGPPGWAPIHLTPEGRERLGGDAWLDVEGLDALTTGLLPLYREPSRHTAQHAIAAALAPS
ncbi:YcaO-like family protein [Lapillicoccus sp.]|uniref:YcaO-like family protein n=1 Tax=Lapillicoccus sp. TaxID=1909287 RepID=UPI0025DA5C3E|nr:YcaO-like family protein [Lapillicoccus sp.]